MTAPNGAHFRGYLWQERGLGGGGHKNGRYTGNNAPPSNGDVNNQHAPCSRPPSLFRCPSLWLRRYGKLRGGDTFGHPGVRLNLRMLLGAVSFVLRMEGERMPGNKSERVARFDSARGFGSNSR